jgi:hypothetical protein
VAVTAPSAARLGAASTLERIATALADGDEEAALEEARR